MTICVNNLLRPFLARPFLAGALAAVLAAPVLAAQAPAPDTIQSVVEAAVQAGHFAQADRAIAQVLAAHPDSATVHYVDARLLAEEGKWPLAQAELQRAERLDPGAGFEHAQALKAFTAQVQEHVQAGPVRSSSAGLIVLASAFILTFVYIMVGIFRARKRETGS
jgi:tetratricopeptide (TPR) repeat protein